jgi:hypothetical protein
MSKTPFDLKRLKLTETTQAWIEAELADTPEKTAQEIVRDELHSMALRTLRKATVFTGIAARRGIRGDDGGHDS